MLRCPARICNNSLKMAENIINIINLLAEVQNDSSVPKNVKSKISVIISTLEDKGDLSIKINKVLNELDDISADINLQQYTRTLVWNIASELENI